jgi:FkbM family methyltransferase
MRRSSEIADSLHVRQHLARYRDRLVERLTGDRSTAMDKRTRTDDNNLMLLLAFGLRRDSNCLDVGANEGLFLRDFRRFAPSGHHIAYEPIPKLAAKLALEYPEMDIRQRALSDADGQRTFIHVLEQKMEGYSGFAENWVLRDVLRDVPTEPITVSTERLDDHLPDNWLPQFVKIDVEGAERLVLEGAIRTFRLAKPTIAFEHGWNKVEDRDRSESIHTLICKDLGLRLFDMDGNGPLGLSEFFDGLTTRWNWVAHE